MAVSHCQQGLGFSNEADLGADGPRISTALEQRSHGTEMAIGRRVHER